MSDRNLEKTKYFVVAFFGAFVLLLAVALWMSTVLGKQAEQAEPEASAPADAFYTPRAEDSLSLLMIGRDTPDAKPQWFFLVRLNALGGEIPVAVFPPQTVVRYEGKQTTLADLYQSGGAQSVKLSLTSLLGKAVDRYASFTGEGLIETVNVLGNIGYELNQTLDYEGEGISIHLAKGRQQVDGQMFYDIVRYPGYQSAEKRSAEIGRLLSAYLNARLPIVLEDTVDDSFRNVINLVDSDLSYADYDSRLEALRFMAKLTGQHATSVLVRGTDDGKTFTLSDSTENMLRQTFGADESPAVT